ncbi:hypothetical protein B0187_05310 [Haemophilus paracuniculus]|uniref:Uncharacterized protein n=1 Tax=Haemophilus paracuniculus TaxID=734 RepID=A0A1T0AS06_9PAST|nr:hypothetical protein B0187_05310 [Haemophilus paracuniculus]
MDFQEFFENAIWLKKFLRILHFLPNFLGQAKSYQSLTDFIQQQVFFISLGKTSPTTDCW